MSIPKLTGRVWVGGQWMLPTDVHPSLALDLRATLRPDIGIWKSYTITPATATATLAQIQTDLNAASALPLKDKLVEIVCQPGTYLNSYPGAGTFSYVRSSTRNPADVIFANDRTSGGVWHKYGGTIWAEGVTFRSLPPAAEDAQQIGAKYPLHITGGDGALTFIDCRFEARNPKSDGGPSVMGWDGGPRGWVTFIGCHYSNLAGTAEFNMHGPDGPEGRVVCFYDCTAPQPLAVGYDSTNAPSRVYFIGGNLTPGGTGGGAVAYTSGWSVPQGGIPPYWRLRYAIA